MSILVWIALGLVAGAAAGWAWGLRWGALVGDVVVGVLGAILGGFMASVTLGLDITQIDGVSVLVAALGAAMLIVVQHSLPPTELLE